MSNDQPPWARPRASDRPNPPPGSPGPSAGRRSPLTGATPGRPGPPPGRRPPPPPAPASADRAAEPAAADPHAGVITGPIKINRPTYSRKSVPGLLAVSAAALISIAALAGRALIGGMSAVAFLVGLLLPLLCVAAVAAGHRYTRSTGGHDAVWSFGIRTADGATVPVSLRTDAPRDALRTGDLVRLDKGRRGSVRAVEVLHTLNGAPVRRVQAHAALSPIQWAGFALAAALLLVSAITLLGWW
ncbi:hypothetical protein OHA21_19085 [Actinoplanes sp. NBC_00393]|uniref:hypothetical protein n=1 Tax=Actinoplanes sp. NBC_00393 TaxID=2975953 RepID=UPI002E242B9F